MTKFNTLTAANSYINRSINPSKWALINGSDGLIWMVTNKEASKLMKAGYELAD